MPRQALFAGLVVDEQEHPVTTAMVGDEPHYVVDDDGFMRHVDAGVVDRQVLAALREQILAHKDIVLQGAMSMMGRDDLFTKAMLDSSIDKLDEHFERLMEAGLPSGTLQWLGMMGFRIVINYHGELLRLEPTEFGFGPDQGYE
jgi:hypothetical protein